MSVSVARNGAVAVAALAVAALVAALVVHAEDGTSAVDDSPAATRVHAPRQALEVVDPGTPAASTAAVSRRLYAFARTVVLADAHDAQAQKTAVTTATSLRVPVLIDGPTAPAELDRLGATTVLTFGHTQRVDGAKPVSSAPARAARVVAELGPPRPRRHRVDALVVTVSRTTDAAAVATARSAGATVLEIPGGDPRTAPAVAKVIADRPTTPVLALGSAFGGLAYPLAVVRTGATQPSGGYLALPGKRYVAMYGHPGSRALGVLGEQGVDASVKRVQRLTRTYQAISKDQFVPTFEIIATVASAGAGRDKNYSREVPIAALLPLVDAAERAGIYVILDLQPGRTDFLTQAKRYRPLLERAHVGLALDPEWRLGHRQEHLRQIGSVDVAEINRVGDWLADLVRTKALPQKLFVLHQFSTSMIKDRSRLSSRRAELATVIHVDGSGSQAAKQNTWRILRRHAPAGIGWGWKNFIDEDPHSLTPRQTWRNVRPRPDLITYQ